jgi:hypothetical protein
MMLSFRPTGPTHGPAGPIWYLLFAIMPSSGLPLVGDRDSKHPGHFGLKLPTPNDPLSWGRSASFDDFPTLHLDRNPYIPVDAQLRATPGYSGVGCATVTLSSAIPVTTNGCSSVACNITGTDQSVTIVTIVRRWLCNLVLGICTFLEADGRLARLR